MHAQMGREAASENAVEEADGNDSDADALWFPYSDAVDLSRFTRLTTLHLLAAVHWMGCNVIAPTSLRRAGQHHSDCQISCP